MKAVIYHAFSHEEAKEHDVQELGSQQPEAFVRAFLKQSIPHWSQQDCESHLQCKAVVLEYFTRQKSKQQQKKSKGLTAKQRRDMRLFDINPEQQSHYQYEETELPMFFYTLSSTRASAPQEQDTRHLIQCPAPAPT
ncbi:ribonuclease P protein subunit p29-like isoform X2 [Peromyscus californicus insignis]|uniref:ribonuclease P protein subunit p29-like isoform X2 n=1 Tax=Peromyscus californicus insignis TaxID=564181 RepID=UPI0022A77C15|nr:ribonuclease P protein subunit p29-like isoform X2 [Peromyscus californicus insignis]